VKKGLSRIVICLTLVLCVIALTLTFGCSTTPTETKELKIGALVGLTGMGSEQLHITGEGMAAAAEWINDNGGLTINGEKYLINLIMEDNKMTVDGSVTGATKLIYEDQVSFISAACVVPAFLAAVLEVTEPAHVLTMNLDGSSTPEELNPDTPYCFHTIMLGEGLEILSFEEFGAYYPEVETVAFIFPDDPGQYTVYDMSKQAAEDCGFTVLTAETYPFGTNDFYPPLTKILAAEPDAIIQTSGMPSWQGSILKQSRELGFTGPMLCSSHPGSDVYVARDIAGQYATDYFDIAYALESSEMTDMIKELRDMWPEKYGVTMTVDHLLGWECLWTLTQGIEKAQSLDPAVVRDTLATMDNIETPFGTGEMAGLETFGLNHVLIRPIGICLIDSNGEIKHLKWVMPVLP
jgi:branched-chain amino acid transport system substrate-binding protein